MMRKKGIWGLTSSGRGAQMPSRASMLRFPNHPSTFASAQHPWSRIPPPRSQLEVALSVTLSSTQAGLSTISYCVQV